MLGERIGRRGSAHVRERAEREADGRVELERDRRQGVFLKARSRELTDGHTETPGHTHAMRPDTLFSLGLESRSTSHQSVPYPFSVVPIQGITHSSAESGATSAVKRKRTDHR